MIQEAIASPDPVLYFEPKSRYWARVRSTWALPSVPTR